MPKPTEPHLTTRDPAIKPPHIAFCTRTLTASMAGFPGNDRRLTVSDLRGLLVAASISGVSDITFQTDAYPRLLMDGILYRFGNRRWLPVDMEVALSELYHATNAGVEIRSRKILDFAYDVFHPGICRRRFRVNATGIESIGGYGMEISLRALPQTTPSSADCGLPLALVDAMTPDDGLVVVAGPTGSGKSTTLAALVRHHFETAGHPRKIIDLQSPVEFTYHDLKSDSQSSPTIISQSEIGKHIRSYADGIRSALRRNPDIIIVGEARDPETIAAVLNASLTGHLVYTTTHANTAGECLSRLLHGVAADEYNRSAFDLANVLRLAMTQKLVIDRESGRRQAHRTFVQLDDRIRMQLLASEPWRWPGIIDSHKRDIPCSRERPTHPNDGETATIKPARLA